MSPYHNMWQRTTFKPHQLAVFRGVLVIMKDASHFAMWQQPDAFNATVLNFLAGKS
jgi:pimeloyl-ACP methyl ester carboxylesterase